MIEAVIATGHRAIRKSISTHFAGRASPAAEATMRAHLPSCGDCRDFYRRHHLLAQLDPGAPAAEERIARGLGFRPRAKPWLRRWQQAFAVPLAATAVAAAVIVVAMPKSPLGERRAVDSTPAARGPDTASAHAPRLLIYRFAANAAGARGPDLVDGAMHAGDELAFAYTNPGARPYLAIFGVDEHQRVYWFHPAWLDRAAPPRAVPAVAGPGPHELPEAIRHVVAGRRLTIYAAFGKQPLDVTQIEAAVRGGPTGASLAQRLGGDIVTVEQHLDVLP
jgi:hypothetical protein